MERIVFLDRSTVTVAFPELPFPHQWMEYKTTSQTQILDRLKDATVAITNKIPIREDVLSKLPDLKLIIVAATGYDCIDIEACRRRGIPVCNLRHYTLNSVPEHTIMLLLNLRRNFVKYQELVKAGEWQKANSFTVNSLPINDLFGSVLGIIGYGALGRGVERIARGFGMDILIAERKGATEVRHGRIPFEEVLGRADAIAIHSPLTPETRNMIGREEFKLLKPSAVLVNCGRGGLIDEVALVDALVEGRIAGAATDVLTIEPPAEGNPLLDSKIPNLIVTPHNAWSSQQAQRELTRQIVTILDSYRSGSPINLVY